MCAQENYSRMSTIAILLLDNSFRLVCHYWNKLGSFNLPSTTVSLFVRLSPLPWREPIRNDFNFHYDFFISFFLLFCTNYFSGKWSCCWCFLCLIVVYGIVSSKLDVTIIVPFDNTWILIGCAVSERNSMIIGFVSLSLVSMTKLIDWSISDINYKLLVIAFRLQ